MITPLDNGKFRAALQAGEAKHGIFAGLAAPMAAEVAAAAGVDFVLLDLEHGGGAEDQIGPTGLATGGYGVATLVRVESDERIRIGRALDAGAAGIMIPRLNSAAQVQAALSHFNFPPLGDRGAATYNRAARWAMDPTALEPRSRATAIIQIETLGALEDVEKIAALDAVDVLFIGPLDLSFALGIPRQFDAPEFTRAVQTVLSAAIKHGKAAGILAGDSAAANEYLNQGFKFIAHSSDSVLLAKAIAQTLRDVR